MTCRRFLPSLAIPGSTTTESTGVSQCHPIPEELYELQLLINTPIPPLVLQET